MSFKMSFFHRYFALPSQFHRKTTEKGGEKTKFVGIKIFMYMYIIFYHIISSGRCFL